MTARKGLPELAFFSTRIKTHAIRLYFLLDNDTMRIIRILHGKRDIRSILEREQPSED